MDPSYGGESSCGTVSKTQCAHLLLLFLCSCQHVCPLPAEKTWKVLEDAIHEINNHNASGLSFEELYR